MRRTRAAVLGSVLSLAAAAVVAPAVSRATGPCDPDWPTFQHDPGRTGSALCATVTALTVPTLAPSWFVPTSGAVTAEPAVVGGTAFVGDSDGVMHAVDVATGVERWTFDVTANAVHVDRHTASYGLITSSASVASVPSLGPTVFFGGGGSVYAVDAATGTPRWATDVDPSNLTSPAEVESSPVVWLRAHGGPVVFVGLDTNEDKGSVDGGVVALNATTGALLWKYDAETNQVVDDLVSGAHDGTGCGDIWSSPALDEKRAMLFFGGGNCKLAAGGDTQRLVAIDANGGGRVWDFVEPPANHGRDEDFGASPVLTSLGGRDVVVQAGKSGWVYVLDRADGSLVHSVHAAEGADFGGFIGSLAVAPDATHHGHLVLFGNTAIPVPTDGSMDPTVANDATRLASLHAVDLDTSGVLWQGAAQVVSYAPTTVANGVVFAPDTAELSINAYDAATGAPLWHLPVGAATSGGVAVAGNAIAFGTGTFFAQSAKLPPQVTGIWCVRVAAQVASASSRKRL